MSDQRTFVPPPAVAAAAPAVHSTKPQYFFSYAVLGSVVPFLSILLAERGLNDSQVGDVWAVSTLGVIFTPILVTLLADTAVAPRFLMAALFCLAGLFLVGLMPAQTFWPILVLYSLHQFMLQPVFPLQDGVHFAAQALRRERGLKEVPYHTVRVWGTIGYIIPSGALYFALKPGHSLSPTIVCGIAFCAIGAIGSLFLPHTPPQPRDAAESRLPTLAAARAIAEPHVLIFCVAMFLIHTASQAYYQFYPLHLTRVCGIDKEWVGLIQQIGTVGEIFYMFAFAWFIRRLSLRRLMYLGALAISLRMVLLVAFPFAAMAIGVQVIHGLTVLVIHVAPPIFLNQRAGNRYRNSIQGLYTMAFAGAGRVIGAWSSGKLAQFGLGRTFLAAAAVSAIATILLYFAFHEGRDRQEDRLSWSE